MRAQRAEISTAPNPARARTGGPVLALAGFGDMTVHGVPDAIPS